MEDEIVEEVRRARAAHAERFGHDLWAIFADMKRQQAESGRTYVSFTEDLPAERAAPHAVSAGAESTANVG